MTNYSMAAYRTQQKIVVHGKNVKFAMGVKTLVFLPPQH